MAKPLFRPAEFLSPKSQAHYHRWIKALIIAGVIVISLGFALVGSQTLILLGLGAIVGAAGILFFLRNPQFGLVALIIVSFFIPTPMIGGEQSPLTPTVLLLVLLVGLWIFDMVARTKRVSFTSSRTLLPLLVFIVITLISLVNGQINYYALARLAPVTAQVSGVATFILSAAAYILVANQVRDLVWLKRAVWVYVIIGGIYVFSRLSYRIEDIIRPFYQYGSDASIFWLWLVTLAFSQAVFNTDLSKRARIALAAVFGLTIYISIGQTYSWKSGWLPALVSIGVMIFVGFPRQRIAVILAGVVLGSLFYYFDQVALIAGGEDFSILTRVEAWRIVIEITKVNPVLGLGPSNYYWYTPLFPILGFSGISFNSHNNYIDIFAQIGIIGLACFLWFMWEFGRTSWKMLGQTSGGFERAYVVGLLGGLGGTLVAGLLGDWVIPFVYNVGLFGFRSSVFGWLFMGGLVLIEQIVGKKSPAPQTETV